MENQEKFWLFIKPHVYVSKERNKCLLYNTQNGEFIETNEMSAYQIVEQLHEKKNLGTILLEQNNITSEIGSFFQEAQQKDIFGIVPCSEKYMRPVQLMPILNIQKDIEKLRKDEDRSIGENILQYLTELTLFVNSDCPLQCLNCMEHYKQVNYCTCNYNQTSLDLPNLQSIAKQIQNAPVGKLNVVGGNIFQYPLLKDIADIFNANKDAIHCWSYYRNFQANELNVSFDILVDFPIDEKMLQQCLSNVPQDKMDLHFLVKNLKDAEFATQTIKKHSLSNADLQPFFTGDNIDFFEKNIYLNKEDILSETIIQRKIFCNQALNFHNFGKLTICSNGDVFANVNTPKLGNIKENSLLELLYKELDENTAWRKTRMEKPCNVCLYQYLCPPTSNYELIIGKPNLCTVKS